MEIDRFELRRARFGWMCCGGMCVDKVSQYDAIVGSFHHLVNGCWLRLFGRCP